MGKNHSKTHDDLVRKLFHKRYHSVFNAVIGPNQSGKTVLAILIMIICHKLKLFKYYGLNIPDLDLPFKYDFIEDLPTLKQRCLMLKASGTRRYLFLADEMGDWAPKDQAWLNVKFIKELQKVRKYGLSLIGCGIDRIDSRILSPSFFHGYFVKRSKTQPDKADYIDWTNYPHTRKLSIVNLPNINIKGFDTYYRSSFHMERQLDSKALIPLTPEHRIVKSYLNTGSWKGANVTTQEGKRALMKVLRLHYSECLHDLQHIKEAPKVTE